MTRRTKHGIIIPEPGDTLLGPDGKPARGRSGPSEEEQERAVKEAVERWGGQECGRCGDTWPKKWIRRNDPQRKPEKVRFHKVPNLRKKVCPECYATHYKG